VKSESRALLTAVVATATAIAVFVAAVGAYVLVSGRAPPTSLPVDAGTVFTANGMDTWAAHFTVGPTGGTLVGGWTAYDGIGWVDLVLMNGTVPKPAPPSGPINCPLLRSWSWSNGSVDRALTAGPYTVYWSTGVCSSARQIDVTQTIQVIPA